MKVLLVDNHDSYTHNLYQMFAANTGVVVDVLTNDDPSWGDIDVTRYDAAVISPGPGTPTCERDIGCAAKVLDVPRLPVLGVCLGHQGIAAAAGATVGAAPQARHGHITTVHHAGHPLFRDIPTQFPAVRYHSLHVEEPLPDELDVLARAEDGVIMALTHRTKPHWGVQFHPESVATMYGTKLVANFLDLAGHVRNMPETAPPTAQKSVTSAPTRHLTAHLRTIPQLTDTERIADYFDTRHDQWVWLDSARVVPGTSRYSILAPADGPDTAQIRYRAVPRRIDITVHGQHTRVRDVDIFTYLEQQLGDTRIDNAEQLPFPFRGGYIGYLGYEAKTDCGLSHAHESETPDAMWIRCHRFVVVDHHSGCVHVVALTKPGEPEPQWVDECARAFATDQPPAVFEPAATTVPPETVATYARPRAEYLEKIAHAQQQLHAGNSYEICYTNTLRLPQAPKEPLRAYKRLRRANPAPYAALLKLDELTIYSSSPERFLTADRHGVIESRPIKGTAPRSNEPAMDRKNRDTLASDPKTVAENLMIVDLVRNDFGRVCETGTITVPKYMNVETYETVHQLVSTIRGKLAPAHSTVDAIRASFPPGSMTGAPKLRTTDIIDTLEGEARGVYSGALGYLSYDGSGDLNVVIRTAVAYGDTVTIGAGGAIVLDSQPDAEYEEMLLKARALVHTFAPKPENTHG